ncbi:MULTISPECIES: 5-formyltetrahydrofolate cyclo-ligase [unclassified Mameliella]|uniref:5-formyltetrahydrofolate cyclo-ligase n=1 Tax=unclassified Mameliella TaxID=2630630 RepID=UPI0027400FC5|nr:MULTISPECIES: 5-formyltetrahydrofolate cyclo-ligase [unclassified Mameliella]
MSNDTVESSSPYASSPCMAQEIAPDYFDPLATDPVQSSDVARWRWAERGHLRAARQALSVDERQQVGQALCQHLQKLLSDRFGGARGRVVSAYWPIKGEPDLRPVMAELHDAGCIVALPVVEEKAAPLAFRRWTPGCDMVRGDWNIPVPSPDADRLTPEIALAPVMGWDAGCFRLGYGGGYFDRTLAALTPCPFTVGIGFQAAKLRTIYPQAHDIPLNLILTEDGIAAERSA